MRAVREYSRSPLIIPPQISKFSKIFATLVKLHQLFIFSLVKRRCFEFNRYISSCFSLQSHKTKLLQLLSSFWNKQNITKTLGRGYKVLQSYSLGTVLIPDVGDLVLIVSSVREVGMVSTSPHIPKIVPELYRAIGKSEGYSVLSYLYRLCPVFIQRQTKESHSLREYISTRSLICCFNYVYGYIKLNCLKQWNMGRLSCWQIFFGTGFWAKMRRIWDLIHSIRLSVLLFLKEHADIPSFFVAVVEIPMEYLHTKLPLIGKFWCLPGSWAEIPHYRRESPSSTF